MTAKANLHAGKTKYKRPYLPVEPRFWARVDKRGPDDCWEWTATKAGRGYGVLSVNGKLRYAHRISLYLAGQLGLDDELHALHRCDNPGCVNPSHLFAGTASDNMRDCSAKGRSGIHRWSVEGRARHRASKQGERSPRAKLTEADVREIFLLRSHGLTQQAIADRVSISRPNVSLILSGKAWGHLTPQSG